MSEYQSDFIEIEEDGDPQDLPPWYEQFLKLSPRQRDEVVKDAVKKIRLEKPETYEFIKKFRCELVGVSPRVEYGLLNKDNTTYIHPYSMPTLLYWCPRGGFHFSVNVNLRYNDTILNKVAGNRRDKSIKGFTG